MVRVKQRYMLIEVVCGDFCEEKTLQLPFGEIDLLFAIRETLDLIHGDYGVGVAGLSTTVQYWNPWTRVFIVKCLRNHYTMVLSSLPFLKSIGTVPASLRCLHLSELKKELTESLLEIPLECE